MNALRYGACFVGIAVMLITAAAVKADTPPTHGIGTAVIAVNGHPSTIRKLAPPVICNMEKRLDIFVDEDGILWECECQVLAKGFICHWQVIGGTDPVARKHKKHRKPKRAIAYTIPAVTM